jgi:hypothetical protein
MKKELNKVKHPVDYVHKEINDLKTESERKVKKETSDCINKVEVENTSYTMLSLISKRDQCEIFYNIQDREQEITTKIINDLLEENMDMVNGKETVKIDRSYCLGQRSRVNLDQ